MQQDIRQKEQNCQQIAMESLIKFRESQRHFKENYLVLLKIENREKLEPLWKGPYEIKKIQGSNAVIQEAVRKHQVHINRLEPYLSSLSHINNANYLRWTLTIALCVWWKLLQTNH
jgi:hypothetical protein